MSESFLHKKSLGQHFLNSDHIPKKLCDAAHLEVGETVLEIGPGTGALTHELLKRGAVVIALEADQRALDSLKERFHDEIEAGHLHLYHHDVRELDLATFGLTPHSFKVVANIPYYLSGFLFRTLLESPIQPHTLVFLVQKEVATRIARDEKESLLSLSVKAFGTPTYICTVARGHFTPPPKVDSAIIAVENISLQHFKTLSIETFFSVLHLGFGQKRKQLFGNLAKHYPKSALEHAFVAAELPLTIRAEDVPLEQWITLVTTLSTDQSPH